MSNKVIGDYSAAATIDGSTNYLLIQPGNASTAYNKINRNVLLGVTGQPADISTSQTFTNKVLDNTNTVTVKDSLLTIQDNLDTTKQAQFQLSGITTATTRTYTLPDASTTFVGTGVTQTLTNKTLTSPTITGGSISNSTVAVDSIGEYTLNNGVTIDGLNIMNGALNTNNSVVTANVTDSAITPAKLQSGTGSGWSWQSWTPTWTNLTIGNATQTASYIQIGKTVFYSIEVVLGNTSSVSSDPTFTLPVTSKTNYAIFSPVGDAVYENTGTAAYRGTIIWASTTTAIAKSNLVSSANISIGQVTSSVPFSFTTGSKIHIQGFYQAA